MIRKTSWLLVVIVSMLAVAATADDHGKSNPEGTTEKADQKRVTLNGTLVCMGCDLKKAENARAECSEYGHTHVLKTEDGRYINLLENKYSADLLQADKYHNKKMEIHGIHHASANVIDVEAYAPQGGKKMSWCDHCKGMDACMAKLE
ncbi:MAG TPA: hypothetical protein VMY05_07840 [Acidobacteriota bacterium]|nr:hypothetical protein [Acidobacteriota bacterium]